MIRLLPCFLMSAFTILYDSFVSLYLIVCEYFHARLFSSTRNNHLVIKEGLLLFYGADTSFVF